MRERLTMKNFICKSLLCILICLSSTLASDSKIITNEEEPGRGVILTPGQELVLQCNNTDDLSAKIQWEKNGMAVNTTDPRIRLEANTLSIEKSIESDCGNYTCISGDAHATIVVRSIVKLGPFDSSRNVVQGQPIVLVCNVTQGIPLPTLQWLKGNNLLNLSDSRIEIKSDARGIEGTELIIADAQFDDRANYTCIASNEISTANASILVRVKDKYAALWPFLGICAEVGVLCTIIFIYEKRRQKPDFDESETEHNTEKNIPDQDEKSRDVRHRK
ncbi:neuroplastin-like isoform X2 [Stegodyphus dumicola]|uniref:neuroplastin-like isoform X2 n=1 Tax=Stegodyphus dumicola TaxID=202533 RepID=UPI0015AB0110|nr:neuroplastin-like isoform X2 [Stegodyphus dumicola]